MSEIVVTVSTRHYKNAVNILSNTKCPLALALLESTGRQPYVGGSYLHFDDFTHYKIPKEWNLVEVDRKMERAANGAEIEDLTLTLIKREEKQFK